MNYIKNNWKRQTILFLISQSITLFGSTLIQMAVVWYVTLQTTSGVWVAAFSVASYLPQFLVSFIGGVWADRYSRKKVIMIADAVIASVTLVMWLFVPYMQDNALLLTGLLIMSVIRSIGAGIQIPAVNAVIPQLVPEDQLMRFNGINATMQSLVQFASPMAAGAILTFSTLRSTLMIDIVTAVMGNCLLACVLIPKQTAKQEMSSAIADIKIGIQYTVSEKVVGKLLMVYGFFVFLTVPAGYLGLLFVTRTFGDTYWYITAMEIVGFIGMMMGGILMSTWGGFKSRVKTMAIGLVAFGTLAVSMGLSRHFILYLVLMLLYGISLTMTQTAITTMLQENTESSMIGRVFGLFSSMYSGFLPMGMMIFGPLADVIPLNWIMVGSGVALIFVAAIAHNDKHIRQKRV